MSYSVTCGLSKKEEIEIETLNKSLKDIIVKMIARAAEFNYRKGVLHGIEAIKEGIPINIDSDEWLDCSLDFSPHLFDDKTEQSVSRLIKDHKDIKWLGLADNVDQKVKSELVHYKHREMDPKIFKIIRDSKSTSFFEWFFCKEKYDDLIDDCVKVFNEEVNQPNTIEGIAKFFSTHWSDLIPLQVTFDGYCRSRNPKKEDIEECLRVFEMIGGEVIQGIE